MIGWLKGELRERDAGRVVLDVGGVGYLLRVPMSTFLELPPVGSTAELHVTTHVREDAITLYGFLTPAERDLFERLNTVSGVGPRIALGALSGLGPGELVRAIAEGDPGRLSSVPGIGKKTAERIVIDLQDKMAPVAVARSANRAVAGGAASDVVSALVNLGYQERQAARAVQEAKQEGREGFEALLREALTRIGKA